MRSDFLYERLKAVLSTIEQLEDLLDGALVQLREQAATKELHEEVTSMTIRSCALVASARASLLAIDSGLA